MTKDQRLNQPPTPAQIIFSGKELVTSRPVGMPYEAFKLFSNYQRKVIKRLFPKPSVRRIAALMPIKKGYNG